MKAYFLESKDKQTKLELREVEQPKPRENQLLVRVRAAGLNRGEFIAGHGLTPPGAAKAAGGEAAGEVAGTGERVMGRAAGAFAEYALMDRREAVPIPAGLSFEQAAAIPLTFMVVHDMLVALIIILGAGWVTRVGAPRRSRVVARSAPPPPPSSAGRRSRRRPGPPARPPRARPAPRSRRPRRQARW